MAADYFTGSKMYWRENKGQWQGILYYTDEKGKRKQKSKLFGAKKRAAQQAFEDWKAELNKQARVIAPQELTAPREGKTVRQRVEEYLASQEELVLAGHLEQSTLTNKRQNAKLYIFPEPIAEIPYIKVGRKDIEEWQKGVLNRGIAINTFRTAFSTLKQVYDRDLENGMIEETPFRFLKIPRKQPTPINYATDESLRKLVLYLNRRWSEDKGDTCVLSYALALYTGLRGEEICGLRWMDIYLPQETLIVRQAIARNHGKPYVKPPKTQSSARKVPLMPEIIKMLNDRYNYVCFKEGVQEPKPNWFVVGERDKFKDPTLLTTNFIRICRNNGIYGIEGKPLSMHGLRHTFATIGVQAKTIDIKSLAAILGHSNVAMTLNTYAGVGDDAMRAEGMRGICEAMRERVSRDD